MVIASETLATIKLVAETIEHVRNIVSAVRDGRAYMDEHHSQAKKHIVKMLEELKKTMEVVRIEASILTGFWFTVENTESMNSFNVLFRRHLVQAKEIESHLNELRGHCSKIRESAEKICAKDLSNLETIFEIFGGNVAERKAELAKRLYNIAYDDFGISHMVKVLSSSINQSLDDVQNALGKNRTMDKKNIQKAGRLLKKHAEAFEPLETGAQEAIAKLEKVIRATK